MPVRGGSESICRVSFRPVVSPSCHSRPLPAPMPCLDVGTVMTSEVIAGPARVKTLLLLTRSPKRRNHGRNHDQHPIYFCCNDS